MRYVHSLKAYEFNHFKFKFLRRTLSAAEIRAGCALPSRCPLASARLMPVVGRLIELASTSATQTACQGGLRVSLYFS
jgi:hypothetical protein